MTTKTVIPVAILNEAKQMFMEYMPVKTIANQLSIPRTTLQYHAQKYWELERNLQRAEMFKNFSDQKKVTMTSISESALKIMTRAIESMADGNEAPSLREAAQASMILESIDKILRLDDGKPTDITEARPTTTIELKKRLSLDPFAEVEWTEVDAKQIEEERNE